ncbi:hypothetical protein B0A55_09880 [Friedmanniomyces simplex]|uniref:Uncharacterized protein n=1 Tax=Friedmanniomyces simplex TaxID=329884 RepID=A0A4U0WP92_9PEZI|nr:hypothetical protein B0A55_09880 [Friedmanniomyces simplex]
MSYPGDQAVVPQQQQQWQSANGSTGQQQQQASTTSQTVTTTMQARYIAQQTPYSYAMTPQPMQYSYARTPQPVQYESSQAQSAYQYPAQQIQAAPPTPAIQEADYNYLMMDAPPEAPIPAQKSSASTTTMTQTLHYEGSGSGGQARQAAEAKGQGEKFESKVQTMIAAMGICPSNYRWYPFPGGYICAGGNHIIPDGEVDMWARNQNYRPQATLVNTWQDPNAPFDPYSGRVMLLQSQHPPEVDLWQPMHSQHRRFMKQAARAAGNFGYGFGFNS